jgi:hypothetical protein
MALFCQFWPFLAKNSYFDFKEFCSSGDISFANQSALSIVFSPINTL